MVVEFHTTNLTQGWFWYLDIWHLLWGHGTVAPNMAKLVFSKSFFNVKNQLDFSENDFLPYMIQILSTSMHWGNYLHNCLYLKENRPRKVRWGGNILMLYVHLLRHDRFQLYILIVWKRERESLDRKSCVQLNIMLYNRGTGAGWARWAWSAFAYPVFWWTKAMYPKP